ncbi:MAG: serpin family protein [Candidatus Riflebacteria bacterium]|nr:serpin family protein [Candidatus Riflebacteria bacterium]
MPRRFIVTFFLFLAILSCGCGGGGGNDGSGTNPISPTPIQPAQDTGDLVRSNLQRQTHPNVQASELSELANDEQNFSLNIFSILSKNSGNLFFSPFSIWQALGMARAGAIGETARQMDSALQFTLSPDRLHAACNALDLALASRGSGSTGFIFRIANSLWCQKGLTFLSSFLDTLALNYDAGVHILDFAKDPEIARVAINAWVASMTEQKITELLAPGMTEILRSTQLVLTNAVYFKADWLHKFEKSLTASASFICADGPSVGVSMMNQTGAFSYSQGDLWQAVELPYDGNNVSLVLILPATGTEQAFSASLNSAKWQSIIGTLTSKAVRIRLPKFKFSAELTLADTLKALGMQIPFTDAADFSGITSFAKLCISDVIHQAFISVYEDGTEAAAATAIVIIGTAAPAQDYTLVEFNRPFLFFIRDRVTGTILFLGRVDNPASK